MSINVNVTGNPVSIRRGKMVVADPDFAKKEFEKRRRIRLEQVRQQSKDIAESVRNKVRKEKSKQLSDLEKQGEQELKKWQARKLLALQQQYQECLKEIGLGHMQATAEEVTDSAVQSRNENYSRLAKQRGDAALQKLREQKEQERLTKALALQRKRNSQTIENVRSTMVSNLTKLRNVSPFKKTKRKKLLTDINISNRLTGDSASETEMPELYNLSTADSISSKSSPAISEAGSPIRVRSPSPKSTQYKLKDSNENHYGITKPKTVVRSIPSPHRQIFENTRAKSAVCYALDTRISDRIKKRTIRSATYDKPDVCDKTIPDQEVHSNINTKHSSSVESPRSSSTRLASTVVRDSKPISNAGQSTKPKEKSAPVSKTDYVKEMQEEFPSKPSVSNESKSTGQAANVDANLNKVQYYDHKNRFFKEYIPDSSNIQKLDVPAIEPQSPGSQEDYLEKMNKRDRDAQVRGKKALERVKIQRDYRDMMQQLPILQRQERIASIPSHKTAFHMSEDRLKQYERKKQNRMENAYEKLFPKVKTITIPSKKHSQTISSDLPFQTIDIKGSPPALNVGSWDFESKQQQVPLMLPKNVESELIREAVKKIPNVPSEEEAATQRRENLKEMLKNITYQRNQLAKQLSALPGDSNLHKLFGQFENIDALITVGEMLNKESTSPQKSTGDWPNKKPEIPNKGSSSTLSPSSFGANKLPLPLRKGKQNLQGQAQKLADNPVSSSSSPLPQKKTRTGTKSKSSIKSKKTLQTISTQTAPVFFMMEELPPVAEQLQKQPNLPKSLPQKAQQKKVSPNVLSVDIQSKPAVQAAVCEMEVKPCSYCKHDENKIADLKETQTQTTTEPEEKLIRRKSSVLDKKTEPTQSIVNTKSESTQPAVCDNIAIDLCKCCQNAQIWNDDVCKIIIKISEDGKPQISLDPKEKKIVVRSTEEPASCLQEYGSELPAKDLKTKKAQKPTLDKSKSKIVKEQKPPLTNTSKTKKPSLSDEEKAKSSQKCECTSQKGGVSWREYLSQNSTNSSTSYFSPPDFTRTESVCAPAPYTSSSQLTSTKCRYSGHLASILRDKRQQSNICTRDTCRNLRTSESQKPVCASDTCPKLSPEIGCSSETCLKRKPLDPQLIQYIQRLLTLSHESVDDLGVSSVSEISTPTSSIMNVQESNCVRQLKQVIKHFDMDLSSIERVLTCSPDLSNVQFNSSESNSSSLVCDPCGLQPYTVTENVKSMTLNQYAIEHYPGVLITYNKLAENCARKIESLAEMIEKVRLDKLSILQSSRSSSQGGSDKENSTKYLDLPPDFGKKTSYDVEDGNLPPEYRKEKSNSKSNKENLTKSSSSSKFERRKSEDKDGNDNLTEYMDLPPEYGRKSRDRSVSKQTKKLSKTSSPESESQKLQDSDDAQRELNKQLLDVNLGSTKKASSADLKNKILEGIANGSNSGDEELLRRFANLLEDVETSKEVVNAGPKRHESLEMGNGETADKGTATVIAPVSVSLGTTRTPHTHIQRFPLDSVEAQDEHNRQLPILAHSSSSSSSYSSSSTSISSVTTTEENAEGNDEILLERFRTLLEQPKMDKESTTVGKAPSEVHKKNAHKSTSTGKGAAVSEKDNPRNDVTLVHFQTASNYPQNVPPDDDSKVSKSITRDHSKPPLSKGLTAAKRFINDIDTVAHELSTIIESDTSKLPKSRTSDTQTSFSFKTSVETFLPVSTAKLDEINQTDSRSQVEQPSSEETTPSSESLPDILTEIKSSVENQKDVTTWKSPGKQKEVSQMVASAELVSDSSASEIENMEAMLKSLGMGWAIATLRKTQEALALTSSSSSVDVSLKQNGVKFADSASTSEMSLRDILGKQFLTKLSSSTGKSSDDSNTSFPFKEMQDISEIGGSITSHEKAPHRTSTPVCSSKTDKSKNSSQLGLTLSGDSELSSVHVPSTDNYEGMPSYYSLNDESSINNRSGTNWN